MSYWDCQQDSKNAKQLNAVKALARYAVALRRGGHGVSESEFIALLSEVARAHGIRVSELIKGWV